MTTNEVNEEDWRVGFLSLLPTNLGYFLIGRHFGLLPFFFPGVVVVLLFLTARRKWLPWQWSILCFVALSVVFLPAACRTPGRVAAGRRGTVTFSAFIPRCCS